MQWITKQVKLSELTPAEYNPRSASAKKLKNFKQNLEAFGHAEHIIANADGVIISGHQRFFLLQEQGVETVMVRMPEEHIKDEKELNILMNKVAGETDKDMLFDMGLGQDDLDSIGYTEFSIPKTVEIEKVDKSVSKKAMYFYLDPEQMKKVKDTFKRIKAEEDDIKTSAEIIWFLIYNYGGVEY